MKPPKPVKAWALMTKRGSVLPYAVRSTMERVRAEFPCAEGHECVIGKVFVVPIPPKRKGRRK